MGKLPEWFYIVWGLITFALLVNFAYDWLGARGQGLEKVREIFHKSMVVFISRINALIVALGALLMYVAPYMGIPGVEAFAKDTLDAETMGVYTVLTLIGIEMAHRHAG